MVAVLLISGCGMMGSKPEEPKNQQELGNDETVEGSLNTYPLPSTIRFDFPQRLSETCENYHQALQAIADIEPILESLETDLNQSCQDENNCSFQENSTDADYPYHYTVTKDTTTQSYQWSADESDILTRYISDEMNLSIRYLTNQEQEIMHLYLNTVTKQISFILIKKDTDQFTFTINGIQEDGHNFLLHTDISSICQDQQTAISLETDYWDKGEYLLLPPNTYTDSLTAADLFTAAVGHILISEQAEQGMLYNERYLDHVNELDRVYNQNNKF